MKQIVIDIETTTWFDQEHIKSLPRDLQIAAMEYGCAVTWEDKDDVADFFYKSPETPKAVQKGIGGFEFWGNDDIGPYDLWERLVSSDLIIGWNIIAFDLPIIARAAGATIGAHFPQVFDLFAIIKQVTGRWYKLQDVAVANLNGRGKTGDGRQAAQWLAEGQLFKAAEYCRVDVELERDVCMMALQGFPIKLPVTSKFSTEMAITVDWNHREYGLSGSF